MLFTLAACADYRESPSASPQELQLKLLNQPLLLVQKVGRITSHPKSDTLSAQGQCMTQCRPTLHACASLVNASVMTFSDTDTKATPFLLNVCAPQSNCAAVSLRGRQCHSMDVLTAHLAAATAWEFGKACQVPLSQISPLLFPPNSVTERELNCSKSGPNPTWRVPP